MNLDILNKYFKKEGIQFKKEGNHIFILNGNIKRKLKKSEKDKKIVSLIKQIAGSSKSSTLSKKSLKKKYIINQCI